MRRITAWWRIEGRYWHKHLQWGIQNLWRWFRVIWNDRDWDYAYALDIIAFKLEKQAAYTTKHGHFTTSASSARQMRIVAELMRRLRNGHYADEYMEYFECDIEWTPVPDHPELYSMDCTHRNQRFEEFFARYPRQYQRAKSGEFGFYIQPGDVVDEKTIAMEIAHYNHCRARRIAFEIMETNYEGWWT